jgi:hypothetical protein
MNILQMEDTIKGLPDETLMQEAQQPTGQVPQYLVISEVQRRSDMRKRYQQEGQEQPQGTVADQVIQEGIAGIAPPPPEMGQAMNGGPPQGMYHGGVVHMQDLGQVPYGEEEEEEDLLAFLAEATRQSLSPEQIGAEIGSLTQGQPDRRFQYEAPPEYGSAYQKVLDEIRPAERDFTAPSIDVDTSLEVPTQEIAAPPVRGTRVTMEESVAPTERLPGRYAGATSHDELLAMIESDNAKREAVAQMPNALVEDAEKATPTAEDVSSTEFAAFSQVDANVPTVIDEDRPSFGTRLLEDFQREKEAWGDVGQRARKGIGSVLDMVSKYEPPQRQGSDWTTAFEQGRSSNPPRRLTRQDLQSGLGAVRDWYAGYEPPVKKPDVNPFTAHAAEVDTSAVDAARDVSDPLSFPRSSSLETAAAAYVPDTAVNNQALVDAVRDDERPVIDKLPAGVPLDIHGLLAEFQKLRGREVSPPDYSDLVAASLAREAEAMTDMDKLSKGLAIAELGAGIAAGDLSGGISKAAQIAGKSKKEGLKFKREEQRIRDVYQLKIAEADSAAEKEEIKREMDILTGMSSVLKTMSVSENEKRRTMQTILKETDFVRKLMQSYEEHPDYQGKGRNELYVLAINQIMSGDFSMPGGGSPAATQAGRFKKTVVTP